MIVESSGNLTRFRTAHYYTRAGTHIFGLDLGAAEPRRGLSCPETCVKGKSRYVWHRLLIMLPG
jgi:hypothetical protein